MVRHTCRFSASQTATPEEESNMSVDTARGNPANGTSVESEFVDRESTEGDSANGPTALPVLPLPGGVVLPNMVVTIALESEEAQAAATAALAHDQTLLLVPRIEGRYARFGVVATVETAGELPTGQNALVLRAHRRVLLGSGVATPADAAPGALWVSTSEVDEGPVTATTRELAQEYRVTVEAYVERQQGGRVTLQLSEIEDPSAMADTIVYWPELSLDRRVEALETIDVETRLHLVLGWVREALAELELREKIRSDVAGGMERQQREFLLRQQLATIRKELGDSSDAEGVAEGYRERLETLALPAVSRAAVEKEIDRLERMAEQNPEQAWIRNWLDAVFALPWGTHSDDQLDVRLARSVLDADTTGLDDAKERIVEWLAVRKLRAERLQRASIEHADTSEASEGPEQAETDVPHDSTKKLLTPQGELFGTGPSSNATRRGDGTTIILVGPPGVGKTSLGESVARAMGRRFVRVSLGGIRDEAEIRGHRRTYVGAKAGRIVEAMKEAGTMNPVILLDEIDKLATGWSGDPASALLEVLDPAQNHTFRDHYLELDLDLSDVIFLATANSLDTIPAPLLDRMETIAVDGYTDLEKLAIARNHLLPRQLELHGLRPGEVDVEFSDTTLRAVIEGYTREAGVRSFERQIAKVLRKAAFRVASEPGSAPIRVTTQAELTALIGRPKRTQEEISDRTSAPGVATGLAVTGAGGDVLFVETTSMPSTGESTITVTGQLGDVMKESASIAMSFVRANATELGISPESFEGRRFHVHFPAGAVPKDGPSAGITMTTAIVSLLTGRSVNPTLAMTGEVTLQGRVLPIGGVKQKLLAAHRAGLKTVIIPKRNDVDLDDVPEEIRRELTIHAIDDVRDVLRLALVS
jgi:ATP-dependent Lon protease